MNLTTILFIILFLTAIDFVLIAVMWKPYMSFGIPIYKKTFFVNNNCKFENLNNHMMYLDNYKKNTINNDKIVYRTKFNIINLYTLAFVSIVKGTVTFEDGKIHVVQVINMTSVYLMIAMVLCLFMAKLDGLGITLLGIVTALVLFVNVFGYGEIDEKMKTFEEEWGVSS